MYIYNTKQKQKQKFESINKNEARIYVCGPTVYDDSHLGHARSAIVFDLLRRVLLTLGYKVIFVKNFTDIDDKIINKLKNSNKSLQELTDFYIQRYKSEMQSLGVMDADIEPRATQSLDIIKQMIQKLLDKGYAYKIESGVYFDTLKDESYLSLSNQILDDSKSRIGEDENKKDKKDFALWKRVDEDEIGFESDFGYGRPGWHIECSAMIKHFLATNKEYQIDIHGGGADLLFPHHENEASQSRCCEENELAKYWMHNGFVKIDNEKMSKSLGNSFFLKDALVKYSGEVLRFYLISSHYRADFNFNEKDLKSCKKRLDKLYRLKKRLANAKKVLPNKTFKENLLKALSDDLNISKALSIIDEMISETNETLDKNPKDKVIKNESYANLELIKSAIGIGFMDEVEYFQLGVCQEDKEKIEELIEQRSEAKRQKDFAKADQIRDKLNTFGVNILDTVDGTIWESIS